MEASLDPRGSDRATCGHDWKPLSFVFETQLLDDRGRVLIKQPALDEAKVYLVCLKCSSYTYMTTKWVSYRLYGSEDQNPDGTWKEE